MSARGCRVLVGALPELAGDGTTGDLSLVGGAPCSKHPTEARGAKAGDPGTDRLASSRWSMSRGELLGPNGNRRMWTVAKASDSDRAAKLALGRPHPRAEPRGSGKTHAIGPACRAG